jgi:hypothetical protein
MKGNIYTIRTKWYTLFVAIIITISPIFSTIANAQYCEGFRTQNQRDWGERPQGRNSAALLYTNFSRVFPDGIVVGCDNKLKLSNAQAVTNLLPVSGRIAQLPSGTLTNPNNRKFNNPFAGQVVALKINLTMDEFLPNFSSNSILLKDLIRNIMLKVKT